MAAIKTTLIALLALCLCHTLTLNAFEFTGKVVGVADGDTITVLYQGNKQYKARLQHIDCPEVGQPFATKAKKNVSVRWRILSAQVL